MRSTVQRAVDLEPGLRALNPVLEPVAAGAAGQAPSIDRAVTGWYERRRYRAGDYGLDRLVAAKRELAVGVTVIVPTRQCAETIAGVLDESVAPLQRRGLLDEVVVVDAASVDGTAAVAAGAGARVSQQDEIRGDLGPALGKGDAMWRALQATSGGIVCFLDGDTADPAPDHLQGLLGPLLCDPTVQLVKGAFDRPLRAGEVSLAHEGGRVTELMARPLINMYEPLLAGFAQPLAGEFAARRWLLEAIPFPVGYGVEIAVMIDALRLVGLGGLAECNLGTRQNRHQPLRALGEMAYAVLAAVEARRHDRAGEPAGRYLKPWDDATVSSIPVGERSPIAGLCAERRLRVRAS